MQEFCVSTWHLRISPSVTFISLGPGSRGSHRTCVRPEETPWPWNLAPAPDSGSGGRAGPAVCDGQGQARSACWPGPPRLAPSVASHHDSGASLARPSSSSGPTVNKLDPSRSARLDRRVSSQNHAASEAELRRSRRQRAQSETLGYDQLSGW